MKEITFGGAINEALHEEMSKNEKVFIMGEDIGRAGGIRGLTKGLLDRFGEKRVLDTPISEESIAGAGVGAAVTGARPIVEIMYADFLPICMDEVANKAGKWRYSHGGGDIKIPLVFRVNTGGGFGGGSEHSQSLEALFLHTPGLISIYPSTPYDAKGLLKASINNDNPILFFEHRLLFKSKGEVQEEEYEIPIGKAKIRKEGTDVTLVGFGYMITMAENCAYELEEEGISVEVIDLRTLKPMDEKTILDSVEKTGKLVTVEEGNKVNGVGAEISAMVAEQGLFSLLSPIRRVGALDVPIPYSPTLEKYVLPTDGEKIKSVVREAMQE